MESMGRIAQVGKPEASHTSPATQFAKGFIAI